MRMKHEGWTETTFTVTPERKGELGKSRKFDPSQRLAQSPSRSNGWTLNAFVPILTCMTTWLHTWCPRLLSGTVEIRTWQRVEGWNIVPVILCNIRQFCCFRFNSLKGNIAFLRRPLGLYNNSNSKNQLKIKQIKRWLFLLYCKYNEEDKVFPYKCIPAVKHIHRQ